MIGFTCLNIYWVSLGFGKHASQIKGPVTRYLKVNAMQQFLYQISLTLTKFSVLLFFYRLFGAVSARFRLAVHVMAFVLFSWLVISVAFRFSSCIPFRKTFDPLIPGHCISGHGVALGTAIANVVIDVVLLLLPMPTIWKLHASRTRRIFLTTAFALGYW